MDAEISKNKIDHSRKKLLKRKHEQDNLEEPCCSYATGRSETSRLFGKDVDNHHDLKKYPCVKIDAQETDIKQQGPYSKRRKHASSLAHKQYAPFEDKARMDRNVLKNGKISPISYKTLESMVQDDSISGLDIASYLSLEDNGLAERLKEQSMDQRMMKMILQVVSKMCFDDSLCPGRFVVLRKILDSKFLQDVMNFLSGLPNTLETAAIEDTKAIITNSLYLTQGLLMSIPKSSVSILSTFLFITKKKLEDLKLSEHDLTKVASLLKDVEELEEEAKSSMEEPKTKNQRLQVHRDVMHEELPPDDFRRIPVFPQPQDINPREDPFIRTNLVSSAYKDQNHYLDVQFRLFREDFVRPLREGIGQHVQRDPNEQDSQRGRSNMKVYQDVTIQFPEPTSSGMLHQVHFNSSRFKRVRWENSKRLIYGNLLCLSSDNFKEDILFATVAQRDPEKLKDGYLRIQIVDHSQNATGNLPARFRHYYDDDDNFYEMEDGEIFEEEHVPSVDMTKKYTMVESEAFFEAYRHVLAGLKEIEDLPLERYIVRCRKRVRRPAYLHDPRYYFSSVLKYDDTSRFEKVDILNNANWPSAEQLQLDESQREAVMNALTKELSIIQGPPGTGKTHVGCIIAKLLLENKKYDQSRNVEGIDNRIRRCMSNSPMLVVCYTNHALDQFLEKIIAFHSENVIRVGGRCKSEELERYSLHAIKKRRRQPRTFHTKTYGMYKGKQKESESLFNENKNVLLFSKNYILNLETLKKDIPERFRKQFRNDDDLIYWLGLTCVFDWSLLKKIKEPEVTPSTGNKTHVEGEAAWAERRRFIGPDKAKALKDLENDLQIQRILLIRKVTAMAMETHEFDFYGGWRERPDVKRDRKRTLQNELGIKDFMNDIEMGQVRDVYFLSSNARWRLYRRWRHDFRERLEKSNAKWIKKHRQLTQSLQSLQLEEDAGILEKADVIGVTTTGAAKYRSIIQKLPIRVMIVEEAAEILEAHVVAAMPKTTEHLILIGDHQQLKPSPTVYELAKHFNLDVSLFERMIKNGIPFTQLQIQHRMRPRFAHLLRLSIYPNLQDHASVQEYEDVVGVRKNVYFITHNQLEDAVFDGKSKANQHEADFMLHFCQYLLHQGYRPDQITILAAYSGQLIAFKKAMKDQFHHRVRVTAVDNFQGEENDIILLSLVRSNEEGSIGFLGIENRVCVALSRAKKGLYCIGNFELLQEKSDLWKVIVENLKQDDLFGSSLPLCCAKHPEFVVDVTTVKDFDKLPEGGCGKPCECRLPCGHVCMRLCHADDPDHKQYKCRKPCLRRCDTHLGEEATKPMLKLSETTERSVTTSPQVTEAKPPVPDESSENKMELLIPAEKDTEVQILQSTKLGHPCKKPCYEDCSKCPVPVKKVLPSCMHEQNVPCYMEPEDFPCKAPCSKLLPCSHKCARPCGQTCTTWCRVSVTVKLPCGHRVVRSCYGSGKATEDTCTAKCEAKLMCGHRCSGSCRECFQGRLHVSCKEKCTRILVCGHECKAPCAQSCPPCTLKCNIRCEHSRCDLSCDKPCTPCKEKCRWKCEHFKCLSLCSEPCSRQPCNEPCLKTVKCGHKCIGLCGEPCPSLCRTCDKEEVQDIFFGDEDEESARFVQLEDCDHVFTYQSLDRWMQQDDEAHSSDSVVDVKMKECPRCKTVVRRSRRYGRVVNQQLELLNKVKEKIRGSRREIDEKYRKLSSAVRKNVIFNICFRGGFVFKKDELTLTLLHVAEVQYNGLSALVEMHQKHVGHVTLSFFEETRKYRANDERKFKNDADHLAKWLMKRRHNFCVQEIFDLNCELNRLKQICAFLKTQSAIKASKVEEILGDSSPEKAKMLQASMNNLRHLLFTDFLPYCDEKKDQVELLAKTVKEMLPQNVPGLGITENERKEIVQAMDFNKGHWYKCPNGHVYCIGECGGATQQSKCPECKEIIGGHGHRLHQSNSMATVMDGATRPAYGPWNMYIPPEE